MYRATMLFLALIFSPAMAAAQQPCTGDARTVVNELYRHMLERNADARSNYWVQQLLEGRERWTDTGLNVREGQMIMFDARGTVRLGPNDSDVASVDVQP